MRLAHTYVVGLGSNLGPRKLTLRRAIAQMRKQGLAIERVSSLYESRAIGPAQPDYLNAAARIRSELLPHQLLEVLQEIEQAHGRRRAVRWGPRTLDLDILWYDGPDVSTKNLVIPHPELRARAFAAIPLADVAPEATIRPTEDTQQQKLLMVAGPFWSDAPATAA